MELVGVPNKRKHSKTMEVVPVPKSHLDGDLVSDVEQRCRVWKADLLELIAEFSDVTALNFFQTDQQNMQRQKSMTFPNNARYFRFRQVRLPQQRRIPRIVYDKEDKESQGLSV